jgi:hypothetical protein
MDVGHLYLGPRLQHLHRDEAQPDQVYECVSRDEIVPADSPQLFPPTTINEQQMSKLVDITRLFEIDGALVALGTTLMLRLQGSVKVAVLKQRSWSVPDQAPQFLMELVGDGVCARSHKVAIHPKTIIRI